MRRQGAAEKPGGDGPLKGYIVAHSFLTARLGFGWGLKFPSGF